MNNGSCTNCYAGYAISGTTCVSLSTINPFCLTFNGLNCTYCSAGYYIGSNGVCTAANAWCKAYNMTNGYCTSCYTGFTLKGTICGWSQSPSLRLLTPSALKKHINPLHEWFLNLPLASNIIISTHLYRWLTHINFNESTEEIINYFNFIIFHFLRIDNSWYWIGPSLINIIKF